MHLSDNTVFRRKKPFKHHRIGFQQEFNPTSEFIENDVALLVRNLLDISPTKPKKHIVRAYEHTAEVFVTRGGIKVVHMGTTFIFVGDIAFFSQFFNCHVAYFLQI